METIAIFCISSLSPHYKQKRIHGEGNLRGFIGCGNTNKNFVFCFAFLSAFTIFAAARRI